MNKCTSSKLQVHFKKTSSWHVTQSWLVIWCGIHSAFALKDKSTVVIGASNTLSCCLWFQGADSKTFFYFLPATKWIYLCTLLYGFPPLHPRSVCALLKTLWSKSLPSRLTFSQQDSDDPVSTTFLSCVSRTVLVASSRINLNIFGVCLVSSFPMLTWSMRRVSVPISSRQLQSTPLHKQSQNVSFVIMMDLHSI